MNWPTKPATHLIPAERAASTPIWLSSITTHLHSRPAGLNEESMSRHYVRNLSPDVAWPPARLGRVDMIRHFDLGHANSCTLSDSDVDLPQLELTFQTELLCCQQVTGRV